MTIHPVSGTEEQVKCRRLRRRFCKVSDRREFETAEGQAAAYGPYHRGAQRLRAAANAIQWIEVECRRFGTARALRDSEILQIRVGMTEGPSYRVWAWDV
jgi:hypothetical protein